MSAAEAEVVPGSDLNAPTNATSTKVTASLGSEFGVSIALVFGYYLIQISSVYYRVYHNYDANPTKRPAYLNEAIFKLGTPLSNYNRY